MFASAIRTSAGPGLDEKTEYGCWARSSWTVPECFGPELPSHHDGGVAGSFFHRSHGPNPTEDKALQDRPRAALNGH